ncbi:MAG TPA: hypothetical protein DCP11_04855 [Microbacteriaceae bacterium]|jgi:hypothetical protein|nr:hypothetical protein [Microbacteriaceae bacterium]
MAEVSVSARRFRSMLVNRHITVGQLAASATTTVDLLALAEHDQNVAFDDLQVIAEYLRL